MKDKLEQYIKANIEEFEQELPLGHKERFNDMLVANNKKKYISMLRIFGSIAALLIISLTVLDNFNFSDLFLKFKYERKIELAKKEIIKLSLNGTAELQAFALSTVNIISSDNIPLIDLLPRELSTKQKDEILKDYYNKKINGLREVKTYVINELNTINNL